MIQNITYRPWERAEGHWLCLMTTWLLFNLLWPFSFVSTLLNSLIKLILWSFPQRAGKGHGTGARNKGLCFISPPRSRKIGLKIYWALPCQPEKDFPHSQSLPSGNLHKPLILIHQRATKKKQAFQFYGLQNENCNHRKLNNIITWITTLCNSWNYQSCHAGPTKMDNSWWRDLMMETEWWATSTFLPWEHHEQCEKAKIYHTEGWDPRVGRCPMCY